MNKYNFNLNLEDRNSLSVLLSRVKRNSTILEFGPANGRMTKYMKEQLNCRIYAVEIDEKSASDASQYTEKIIVDSIENYTWKQAFSGIQFDYIIFADVLEHLYYPEEVLLSIKDFLKDDGKILVSIPNIAHNAIILGLLKNEFNYSQTGLLDNTHIRFFTKKTFDTLIEKSAYYKSFETAIFYNPVNTELGNSYEDVPNEVGEYLSKLQCGEIYQLIYEFQKYHCELISDFSDEYKVISKYFIQLFIDDKNGFSEESSIKFPLLENNEIQKFKFDLKDKKDMKNLRLDLLNDCCVVEIEKLCLLQKDGQEIDLFSLISSNVSFYHDKNYFFETSTPQIYFERLDLELLKFSDYLYVELKYIHISKDALHVCANQITADKNYRISILEKEKAKTQESLSTLENELISVYTSKSWKIITFFRNIIKNIKG